MCWKDRQKGEIQTHYSPSSGSWCWKAAAPQGVNHGKGCSSHSNPCREDTQSTPSSTSIPSTAETPPARASPASTPLLQEKLKRHHCHSWHWDPRTEAWSLALIKMQHPSVHPPPNPKSTGMLPTSPGVWQGKGKAASKGMIHTRKKCMKS